MAGRVELAGEIVRFNYGQSYLGRDEAIPLYLPELPLGLGVIEGLTRVFYPEGSATVVFVIMAIVLLVRPAGLFGKA